MVAILGYMPFVAVKSHNVIIILTDFPNIRH